MKVSILTEGGKNAGFGHFTRCLALAQGIKKYLNSEVKFVINGDKYIEPFLLKQHIKPSIFNWVKDKKRTLKLVKKSDLVIIDSYLAPKSLYFEIFNILSLKYNCPVVIDDYIRIDYPPSILISPSIYGEGLRYRCPSRFKSRPVYLLGKDYIILRKEFWKVPKKYIRKKVKNVLITFGGKNRINFTKKIAQFLSNEFSGFNFHAIIPNLSSSLYTHLSAGDMLEFMMKSDICISAGGQTLYELARCGVPTIGICFAKNQERNLKGFHKRGFLKYLGWYDDSDLFDNLRETFKWMLSYKVRERGSIAGRKLVDGNGVKRIIKRVEKIKNGAAKYNGLLLKPATRRDCYDLWVWRNHPRVRQYCFETGEIGYIRHKEWFEKKIKNKKSKIYIAVNKRREKVGQIRFERQDCKTAFINVNLNPRFLGRGYGNKIIRLATESFMQEEPKVKEVVAEVINKNTASKKVFQEANYVFSNNTFKNNRKVSVFKFKRGQ